MAHAVKLIDVSQQGQFSVTNEGSQILNSVTSPCNLVFIFGNARSGKSFIMNRLLACANLPNVPPNLFKVINSAVPCTKGVDLSSIFVPQKALSSSSENSSTSVEAKELKVGFVDVEGQGDAGEAHDTLLALPLLLTSKVVLFNHKGAPTVGYMLEKLGVLARAAQKVRSGLDGENGDTNVNEDDDDDEDDDGKQDSAKKPKLFGHLHILFRDFSFDGDENTVLQQLLTLETVPREKKTLGNKQGYDPSEAIRDRNQIRRLIKHNFESVNAWIFPQPASPDILKDHAYLPEDLITPAFADVTKKLFSQIATQTSQPRLFSQKPVDGPKICELQSLLVDTINKGNIIDIPSVMQAMEIQRLHAAQEKCVAELTKALDAIEVKFPLSSSELSGLVAAAVKASNDVFERMIAGSTLDAEIKTAREQIANIAEQKTRTIEKRNGKNAWALTERVLKSESQNLIDSFRSWSADKMGSEDEELVAKFEALKKLQRERIKQALAHVPQVLVCSEYVELLRSCDEKPDSFLSVVLARNTSHMLDIKAKKIAQESERQLAELVAKNDALLDNALKTQQESVLKTQEMEKQAALAIVQKETAVKNAEEKASQLKDKNAKLLELARQRDVERIAKEKLAKQIAELEQEKLRAAEEKKALDAKGAEMHVEGWLMKKGREWPFNWKRRYFKVENGVLGYYKDQKCKDQKGRQDINMRSVIHMLDPRAPENKDKKFGIQVISDDRSIIIKPVDEGEVGAMCQKEWDTYLRFVAAGISRDSASKPRAPTAT